MPTLDQQTIDRITKRGVAQIIPEDEFIRRLQEGRPLRLKMGFDPSRPDLHLGHVVGLRKLRQLQDLGHELILIVGDWTAQIGDPSGASETRTMLSAEDVRENAETYMRQFFKVMDPNRTRAVYQSEWFGKFTLSDVIRLTSHFTVNQFLHRDDFAQRYAGQRPIAVTEMLYPLLQAYDSVAIEADVEFGGTDQLFNLLVGRELQEKVGQRPQLVFTMPILPGTDGVRKMSKSLDNYIAIEDTPRDMFGKIMSLPDDLIPVYFELLTDVPDDELDAIRAAMGPTSPSANPASSVIPAKAGISSLNPMDLKKRLGEELTAVFHSPGAATAAREEFERVFQRRETPEDIPEVAVGPTSPAVVSRDADGFDADLSHLLPALNLAASRSEARRLLQQNAVQIDGERPDGERVRVPYGALVRVGSRRFARVVRG
ncbi:MAG: tyrosine--tRNA ligase [Chloroflexota bacterium]|nr:tyrosine--tRNA ligase [Chloroflexota bacterium]MDE2885907.1 tyrosine--tRNA ligase [Chloroflexota bacterium]